MKTALVALYLAHIRPRLRALVLDLIAPERTLLDLVESRTTPLPIAPLDVPAPRVAHTESEPEPEPEPPDIPERDEARRQGDQPA